MRYVYIIAVEQNGILTGPCKIGTANDPDKRRAQLQTGSAYDLAVAYCYQFRDARDAGAVEKSTQADLQDCQLCGEWFDIDPVEATMAVGLRVIKYYDVEAPRRKQRPIDLVEDTGLFQIDRSLRALGDKPMPA